MKMLTVAWLKKQHACSSGIEWFQAQSVTTPVAVLTALMEDTKYDWANWLIVRVMTRPQYIAYAVYSAEQVLNLYEQAYPHDPRPRQAIAAARQCLASPTAKKKRAAARAAEAAWAAARAAGAAWAAAGAAVGAAGAAWAAVGAARAAEAAGAAVVAAGAAVVAAGAAGAAGAAAEAAMQQRIITYGISLIAGKEQP